MSWPQPDQLRLVLTDGAGVSLAQRSMPVNGADCAELPETVALIIGVWLARSAVVTEARLLSQLLLLGPSRQSPGNPY